MTQTIEAIYQNGMFKPLNPVSLENNMPLVTNNESHFNRISGLQVLNWNK